jgi:hypothetical protein
MDDQERVEGAGNSLGIGQKPCAFVPAGLVPVQIIPKDQRSAEGLSTSGTVEVVHVVDVCAVLHLTLRSCGSMEPGGSKWKLPQYRASHKTCNQRIHRWDDEHARAWELWGVTVLPTPRR